MMWIAVAVLAATVGACVWLATRPVALAFSIEGSRHEWYMSLALRYLWWSMQDRWQIPRSPAGELTPATAFDLRRVRSGFGAFRIFARFIQALWDRITVTRFHTTCTVGLGDPAGTAMMQGYLSGLLAFWINQRVAPRAVEAPMFSVYPRLDGLYVAAEITGIIRFSPADIMVAGMQGLTGYQGQKGGHQRASTRAHHDQPPH